MWWLILVFLCVPATCATLDSQAVSSRKLYFGTATDNLAPEEENDTQYQTLLGSEFGCVTPGNSMKWDHTEPSQGTFDFAAGDAIVNFTQAHGQIIRGHNLVWYQQ
jgi:endo-1,4-beta-xylanase